MTRTLGFPLALAALPLAALLLAALLLAGCSSSSSRPASPAPRTDAMTTTGFVFGEASSGGQTLKYAVYVPRGYTPEREWPLILFLHGRGESGSDGQKQIIQGVGRDILWNAERWPAVVLFPQKPDQAAQWEAYEPALMALVARAREQYSIDEDRIALTGLSQGGHGAWALGAAHPELWSAVAPICGYPRPLKPDAIAAALRRTPVWAFHGDADDIVPPSDSAVIIEALRSAQGDVRFTLYPGVSHNSWDRAYAEKDLPAFLMQPKRRR